MTRLDSATTKMKTEAFSGLTMRIPIGEMARSLGLSEAHEELQRIRRLYDKMGVPDSR